MTYHLHEIEDVFQKLLSLDEGQGSTFEEYSFVELPLLGVPIGILFPKQTLTLRLKNTNIIKQIKACIEGDRVFAFVPLSVDLCYNFAIYGNREYLATVGTTAQIIEFNEEKNENIGNSVESLRLVRINYLTIKFKGHQRFKLIKSWPNIDSTLSAQIQILPEIRDTDPFSFVRPTSWNSLSLSETLPPVPCGSKCCAGSRRNSDRYIHRDSTTPTKSSDTSTRPVLLPFDGHLTQVDSPTVIDLTSDTLQVRASRQLALNNQKNDEIVKQELDRHMIRELRSIKKILLLPTKSRDFEETTPFFEGHNAARRHCRRRKMHRLHVAIRGQKKCDGMGWSRDESRTSNSEAEAYHATGSAANGDRAIGKDVAKNTAYLMHWPSFVYHQYDTKYLVQAILNEIFLNWPRLVRTSTRLPTDPFRLFCWINKHVPIDYQPCLKLLNYDNIASRLYAQWNILKNYVNFMCKYCDTVIFNKKDVFNPPDRRAIATFVNPSDKAHEFVTVIRVHNTLVHNEWSADSTRLMGYTWAELNCRKCNNFLGWVFYSDQKSKTTSIDNQKETRSVINPVPMFPRLSSAPSPLQPPKTRVLEISKICPRDLEDLDKRACDRPSGSKDACYTGEVQEVDDIIYVPRDKRPEQPNLFYAILRCSIESQPTKNSDREDLELSCGVDASPSSSDSSPLSGTEHLDDDAIMRYWKYGQYS